MKTCRDPGCAERVHARSRCFDHWCALVKTEARAITTPRRRAAQAAREKQLFVETRKARLTGDAARRAFIIRERRLPEELPTKRRGAKSIWGGSIDRTFVSDITLDSGESNWHGYDYFGDTQFADWPEREKLGVGGRNLSRRRK